MSLEIFRGPEFQEHERRVPYAFIFDIDGVLTHPSEKRVTEPTLFQELQKRLERKEPVILNTGRAVDFIIAQILEPLEKLIVDKNLFRNLFAVGEKGAVTVKYDETEGKRRVDIDQTISVPKNLQKEVEEMIDEGFSDVAFYDSTKRTMISIEMHDGLSVEKFREKQRILDDKLREMLKQYGLADQYKVDPSRIATDLENKHVGKGLGVQRALAWLKEQNIQPDCFLTFGDSPSDAAMAIELQEQKLPVEFIFVGEKELLAGRKFDFPVKFPSQHCEEGTLQYLKNL